jgi:hypothetical protein
VNLVVDIAVEYTDAMGGWQKVLDVLEKAPNAAQMEFAYLARRISTSEEPEEHYRYIVAASKCQQFQACIPTATTRSHSPSLSSDLSVHRQLELLCRYLCM